MSLCNNSMFTFFCLFWFTLLLHRFAGLSLQDSSNRLFCFNLCAVSTYTGNPLPRYSFFSVGLFGLVYLDVHPASFSSRPTCAHYCSYIACCSMDLKFPLHTFFSPCGIIGFVLPCLLHSHFCQTSEWSVFFSQFYSLSLCPPGAAAFPAFPATLTGSIGARFWAFLSQTTVAHGYDVSWKPAWCSHLTQDSTEAHSCRSSLPPKSRGTVPRSCGRFVAASPWWCTRISPLLLSCCFGWVAPLLFCPCQHLGPIPLLWWCWCLHTAFS